MADTRHSGEGRNPHVVVQRLLSVAYRHAIDEPTIESAFERIQKLTTLDYPAFRDAIDACLRDGLIRDPVRIEEGALQCHWKLELTPKGVAAARAQSPSPLEGEGRGEGK